ncbi:HU family DNA-binding protein [Bacteroides sp.]|uniref:HU family DNA-binding protein n=1 Tax=Bacteroides sp. TaxID=29523 RepID=UPI00261CA618|nr:HU family DNA-binding protein [Bacteroides sp.]
MAYYVMEEMPDIHKKGERVLYPRFAMIEQISTDQLAKFVAESSGFNMGDIVGIVKQIAIEMAHQMAQGRSVKLDDIGTFTPALALRDGKEREKAGEDAEHRNAQSIVVGKVNFRVDLDMVRRINSRCLLERAPWKTRRSSQHFTPEQRLALAVKHLDTHPFLTVSEYQRLTGLLRTTATNELRQWAGQTDSGIETTGRGVHRVYIKKNTTVTE